MNQQLRIWRVTPTSQTGNTAPSVLVETSEVDIEKAQSQAVKLAKEQSPGLARFDSWKFIPTKLNVRKDIFGRYIKYHQ